MFKDAAASLLFYGITSPMNDLLRKDPRYQHFTKRQKRDFQDFLTRKHLEIAKMAGGAFHEYIEKRDSLRWGFEADTLQNISQEKQTSLQTQRQINTLGARTLKKITGLFQNKEKSKSRYYAAKIYESAKEGFSSVKQKAVGYTFISAALLLCFTYLNQHAPVAENAQHMKNIGMSSFVGLWSFLTLAGMSLRFLINTLFSYRNYNSQIYREKDFMTEFGHVYYERYIDKIFKTYDDFMKDESTTVYRYHKLNERLGDSEFYEHMRYDPVQDNFFITNDLDTTDPAFSGLAFTPSLSAMRQWCAQKEAMFGADANWLEVERQRRRLRSMTLWDVGYDKVYSQYQSENFMLEQMLAQQAQRDNEEIQAIEEEMRKEEELEHKSKKQSNSLPQSQVVDPTKPESSGDIKASGHTKYLYHK